LPHGIEAVVVVLPLGHDAIELHAERIRLEQVRALAVVEGVEVHRDGVVDRDLFPFRQPGTDLRRIVPADEHDVQVGIVVTHIRRRRDADGNAVARLALAEVGHANAAGRQIRCEKVLEPGRLIHTLRDEVGARRLSAQRLRRE